MKKICDPYRLNSCDTGDRWRVCLGGKKLQLDSWISLAARGFIPRLKKRVGKSQDIVVMNSNPPLVQTPSISLMEFPFRDRA